MRKLKNIQRIIARELVAGIELRDICDARNLSYSALSQQVAKPAFQAEIERLQTLVDESMLEQLEEADSVTCILRSGAKKAAKQIVAEVDNADTELGATPNTRLKASKDLLSMLGYVDTNKQQATIINLHLSEAKINLATQDPTTIQEQPDTIDEHVEGVHVKT